MSFPGYFSPNGRRTQNILPGFFLCNQPDSQNPIWLGLYLMHLLDDTVLLSSFTAHLCPFTALLDTKAHHPIHTDTSGLLLYYLGFAGGSTHQLRSWVYSLVFLGQTLHGLLESQKVLLSHHDCVHHSSSILSCCSQLLHQPLLLSPSTFPCLLMGLCSNWY